MKRRNLLIVLIVLLLAAGAAIPFFMQTTVSKTVTLPYTHTKVMEQLSEGTQVVRWWAPFSASKNSQVVEKNVKDGANQLDIQSLSGIAVALRLRVSGQQKMVYLKAIPDSARPFETDVTLYYKTSLWRKWTGSSGIEKNASAALDSLKNWMTDTRRFYGFVIEKVPVTDTFFLFSTRTVATAQLKTASETLYKELIDFAAAKELGYTGVRIFNARKADSTHTELYASIGIRKEIENRVGQVFQFKAMPKGKNLLVAHYDGLFRNAGRAYEALDNYRRDHSMQSMAMPFSKIMQEGTGFADNDKVKLTVTLPVY
jgi:effector-binding domain-containing protein